jgi:hypothetical protein
VSSAPPFWMSQGRCSCIDQVHSRVAARALPRCTAGLANLFHDVIIHNLSTWHSEYQ